MNKLINKTLFYFISIAILLLVISAPLFYYMMERLYLEDVNESILIRKDEFKLNHLPTLTFNDIANFNRFNRDVQILGDTISPIQDQISLQYFWDKVPNESEPYQVLYTRIYIQNEHYWLMVRMNLVESEDLIKTLTGLYLTILFILLVVLFLIISVVSKKLWSPFYDTLEKIDDFNLEQSLFPQFSKTKTEEFKQLNSGLEKLIKQNLDAYKTQKEFTENASHELQTPLAVFRSKLDVLLQEPGLTENQATIISSLYDACSRLARINKNLLLLSKIENQYFTEKTEVNVVKLLQESIPYFNEQAQAKNLKIVPDIAHSELVILANKGLIEILINNLLLNAIRHNYQNGKVQIEIKLNQLIISNTGSPDPLDLNKLFKRFSKTSENAHSSGLGLAIIYEICEMHGWKVNYQFLDRSHTFSVTF